MTPASDAMGHGIFIVLHFVALLFAAPMLIVTIPLHLIYTALRHRSASAEAERPTAKTHLICPICGEFVRREARICKHCHTRLVP